MQSNSSKVTDINAFSRRPRAGVSPGTPALDACRESAVERIEAALVEALGSVAETLLAQAEKASLLDMYHLHLDARDLARDYSSDIGRAFRTEFLRLFNAACRRDMPRDSQDTSGDLTLVEPDDLEESLSAQALATAIGNACAEELFGLGQRVGLLIDDPDMAHGVNPLGPENLGAAVIKALGSLEGVSVTLKSRLLVASMLNRELPRRVKSIYQSINHDLVGRGVLPTLRVGLHRSRHEDAPRAPVDAGEAGQDLFARLSQLVGHVHREGAGAPSAGGFAMPAWPMQALSGAEAGLAMGVAAGQTGLWRNLDRLQRGEAGDEFGIQASAMTGGVNILHGLRPGLMAQGMAPMDATTLDIVAMLFDYILDDARIPDAMKALIGRLQIPMLKLAMRDKSFFARKTHPARMLLDTLAEAAIGWDAGEGHEGGLYRAISDLVQGILDDYDDDAGVFASALDHLRAYLDAEAVQALRRVDGSARVIHDRERVDLAGQVAHAEVATRLIDAPLDEAMRARLLAWWEPWLAGLHAADGDGGRAWTRALANLDDLIWSLQPKTTADARRRFLALLPDLIGRLRLDLASMARAEGEQEAFFAALVACHAEVVKGETPTAVSVDTGQDEAHTLAATAPAPSNDEFVALPETPEPAPDTPLEIIVAREETRVTRPGLADLKRGTWIEYRQGDGQPLRVRLFWISPLKGLYLFSNRLGQRAISISAEGLERKLRDGEVTLVDDMPLVDRAVDRMVDNLSRQNA